MLEIEGVQGGGWNEGHVGYFYRHVTFSQSGVAGAGV